MTLIKPTFGQSSLRSRGLLAQALAALALGLVLAVFYFVHVPARKSYLTARNFRLLADSGDQIKSALADLHTSVKNAATATTDGKWSAGTVAGAIRNIVPKLEIVRLVTTYPPTNQSPRITIKVLNDLNGDWLQLDLTNRPSGEPAEHPFSFTIRTDWNSFIQRLIPRHEFDEVLLAREDGKVIFQSGGDELHITRLPISTEDAIKPNLARSNLVVTAATLGEVTFSGIDYKMFSQPIQFLLPGADEQDANRWFIVGLLRTKEFRTQTLAVPYTGVILFVFALGLILLAWPFLDVVLAGAREELRIYQAIGAAASAFAACGVLVLLLFDFGAYKKVAADQDEQLELLADRISTNLMSELTAVNQQLHAFENEFKHNTRTQVFAGGAIATNPYPFLSMVVWVGDQGQQQFKWAAGSNTTKPINVGDRGYFRHIVDGESWPWRQGLDARPFEITNGFYLEPIHSRTRGENVAEFSIASHVNEANLPWVVVAEFRPQSLMNCILPAGFGFCVIEPDGYVLFHSEERRNLRENFITECEDNARLKAAISSRIEDGFHTRYFRKMHRLHVMPLRGIPWTLVTFRDEQLLGASRLQMLSTSVILFGFHALIVVFGLALTCLALARNRFGWLWPDPMRTRSYTWIILSNGVLALIFVGGSWFNSYSSPMILAMAAGFPLVAVVVAWWLLEVPSYSPCDRQAGWQAWLSRRLVSLDKWRQKLNRKAGGPTETTFGLSHLAWLLAKFSRLIEWIASPFKYRSVYVLAAGSLLALAAVLPAVAYYRIGFEQEMERFVKYTQLQLAQDLQQRVERIRTEARSRPETNYADLCLDKSWDRYEGVFFNTQVMNNMSPHKVSHPDTNFLDKALREIRPQYTHIDWNNSDLVFDAAMDGSWKSRLHEGKMSLSVAGGTVHGRSGHLEITSGLPAFRCPPAKVLGWIWYLAFMLVLAVPFLFARLIAHRVFLSHLRTQLEGEIAGALTLSHRWSFDDLKAESAMRDGVNDPFVAAEAARLRFLDLRLTSDRDVLARPGRNGVEPDALIVLCNEDFRWQEARQDEKKRWLAALERDHRKTVIHLRPSDASSSPQGRVKADPHRQAIALKLAATYEKLWSECTPMEQLTLLQVAATGLVNSERPELRTLLARGLLCREPELRLMDECFRRFVVGKGQPDTQPPPQNESSLNWRSMKTGLWVLLTGAALLLFLTQRDAWNVAIALATAFITGYNILNQFSKAVQPGKEKPAQ